MRRMTALCILFFLTGAVLLLGAGAVTYNETTLVITCERNMRLNCASEYKSSKSTCGPLPVLTKNIAHAC